MRILGEEHDDCENWARWCWDLQLSIGYPGQWLLADVRALQNMPQYPLLEGLIERDKNYDQFEAEEAHGYNLERAFGTNDLFQIWLDRCRTTGNCYGKRQYIVLRGQYLQRRDMGELTVREALGALADLKQAQQRALERPRLAAVA
jgi:hypothetical protein